MKASTENCKQFQDEEEMPDAKVKAIEALVDVHVQVIFLFTEEPYELFQCSLKEDVAPVLNHILKFCAAAANKSVVFRRKLHVNAVKGSAGKDRLAKLKPKENYLFGKEVSNLIKSMSDNVKVVFG